MIDRANGKRIERRIKRLVAEGKIATAQGIETAKPPRGNADAPKGVGHAQ